MMLTNTFPIKMGTSKLVMLHENPIQQEKNVMKLFLELCLPEAKVVYKQ